jgi:hypothetical protein
MPRLTFSRRNFLISAAAAPGLALASHGQPPAAPPAFPKALVHSLYTRAIWSDGKHNGFPGIARVGNHFYVTFRSSEGHQAPTAKIVVIRSKTDDLKTWDKVAEFTRDHDCRDPLVFDNGGKVQVVFHSKEDFFSQSTDGTTWTEAKELDTEFPEPKADSGLVFSSQRRWLFRIRKGPDGAFYSLARCGIKEKDSKGTFGLILFRSEDGVKFKALHTYGEGPTRGMALDGVGRGWGHEADVTWTKDGTLVSAIRSSKDGVVMFGRPPAGPWTGYGTGVFNFGGPALHTTVKGGILLAARDVPEKRVIGFPAVCKVWTVTRTGLENPFVVPSGGDCAYQSFADLNGETVLLAYYSSHEYLQDKGVGHNPANVYLAFIRTRHVDG